MHSTPPRRRSSRHVLSLIAVLLFAATAAAGAAPRADAQQPCILIFPPPPGCQQPVVGRISVSAGGPYGGRVGQAVIFRATVASPLPPGTPFQFSWNFGDGFTGVGQATSHVYRNPGTYVVTVVVNGGGQTATDTTSASITQPIQPLQVSAGGPYAGQTNTPLQFRSSVTGAPFGTQVSYQWGFGDGTFGSGPNPTHSYAAPGLYTVTLQVTTSAGQSGFASTTAQVTPPVAPLVANAGGPYAGIAGSSVTFFGSASGARNPVFQWTFGDGNAGAGQSVAHTYVNAGTYTVVLTVTDLATGSSTQSSTTATIGAPAPPPGPPPPPPAPPAPQGRSFAAMAFHPPSGRVLLFGGLVCQGSVCSDQNDTWTWDGSAWSRVNTFNAPSSRYSAAIGYHAASQRIVLFGGVDCNESSCTDMADTWAWDGSNWSQLNPGTVPQERADASMAYDQTRNALVMFGGQDTGGSELLGDTWTFDGENWTRQEPSASPAARYGAAMDFDIARGVAILVGGTNNGAANLSDTWTWDGSNWTQQNPSISPTPRAFAGMVYDAARNLTVLFGGATNGNQPLGDTWIWNGETWAQQNPSTNPPPRYGPAMTFNGNSGLTVLFSGTNGDNDTWTWDGNTWTRR